MSNNNGDTPAMPARMIVQRTPTMAISEPTLGLTKRERFAESAMQGILSDAEYCRNLESDEIASMAVEQADQLLAALEASS